MFEQFGLSDLKQQVESLLAEQPELTPNAIAQQLNISEGEATLALPEAMVTTANNTHAQTLLEKLAELGRFTTIIHSAGSIFEFKGPFPKGKVARGYYNLMNDDGLTGHLNLTLVQHIAFVSKPFMGVDSHFIGFYTDQGDCIFKVYLGRDEKRQLFAEQLTAFTELKQTYCHR